MQCLSLDYPLTIWQVETLNLALFGQQQVFKKRNNITPQPIIYLAAGTCEHIGGHCTTRTIHSFGGSAFNIKWGNLTCQWKYWLNCSIRLVTKIEWGLPYSSYLMLYIALRSVQSVEKYFSPIQWRHWIIAQVGDLLGSIDSSSKTRIWVVWSWSKISSRFTMILALEAAPLTSKCFVDYFYLSFLFLFIIRLLISPLHNRSLLTKAYPEHPQCWF